MGVLNIKDLIVNETNHEFKNNIRKVEVIKRSIDGSKNAEKVQLLRRMRDTEYFRGFVNKGNTRPLPFKHRIVFMLNRWGLDYVLILSNWLMEKAQQ